MRGAGQRLGRTARELREAFDGVFAEPRTAAPDSGRRYLRGRVEGVRLALPLATLAGVRRDVEVAVVPGARPPLLGMVAWLGEVVPAFSLGHLLGLEPGPPPRWLARCRWRQAFALGLHEVHGVERVRDDDRISVEGAAGELLPWALPGESGGWRVVDLDRLARRIADWAGLPAAGGETA